MLWQTGIVERWRYKRFMTLALIWPPDCLHHACITVITSRTVIICSRQMTPEDEDRGDASIDRTRLTEWLWTGLGYVEERDEEHQSAQR